MNKALFLAAPYTQALLDDLAHLLVHPRIGLNFPLSGPQQGRSHAGLAHALESYAWPSKAMTIEPFGRVDQIRLAGGSSYTANEPVLQQLASELQRSLATGSLHELRQAVWSVLHWGGVLNGGNRQWLNREHADGSLRQTLLDATELLRRDDEDALPRKDPIRSNAGLTKVYSLVIANFVIYDSRVAAALSWLVLRWFTAHNRAVPDHLRFGCMAHRSGNNKKLRCADRELFPVLPSHITGHRRHAVWNLRASWLIEAWVQRGSEATAGHLAWTTRQVEAALFMIGDDLTQAVQSLSRKTCAGVCH